MTDASQLSIWSVCLSFPDSSQTLVPLKHPLLCSDANSFSFSFPQMIQTSRTLIESADVVYAKLTQAQRAGTLILGFTTLKTAEVASREEKHS